MWVWLCGKGQGQGTGMSGERGICGPNVLYDRRISFHENDFTNSACGIKMIKIIFI